MEKQLIQGISPGQGTNSDLGTLHGTAIEFDSLSSPIGTGQSVNFHLQVVTTNEEMISALSVTANASYSSAVFSGNASAQFISNRSVSRYSTFVVARCVVKNPEQVITTPRPRENVDKWRQQHSKADFQKLYGEEFLSGFITGGYYFGIIQIHSTSEAKQQEIAAAVAGSGWGATGDASVAVRLQSVTESLEKEVVVYRDGGDSNQALPRTIDEMIEQIINFPGQVRQDAVPFSGIYQNYDQSIPFSPYKEETGLDLALRRADLNELAHQFLRLKELRADVIFVSDHYHDYQRGAGVIFSFAGETFAHAPLPQSAAELRKVASDISQQMQLVVQTAAACRQGLEYQMPEPYILPIQLPEIEGQNMELEKMKKALVPDGTIVMWSGDVEDIPEPWALCDGQNGTPDLRDKFIVGAGSTYAIRQEGGKETVELTVEHLPGHTHPASTAKAGDHTHSFTGSDGGWAFPIARRGDSRQDTKGAIKTSAAGAHTHAINIQAVGGNQPHENRPPFYALCYIIKL
ncbi:MAG: hypothetical protein R6X18_12775 [Chloroflexota bacterium]